MKDGLTTEPEEIHLPDHPNLPQVPMNDSEAAVPAKLTDIINPVQLAFKAALLPILLENTKIVRERMKPGKVKELSSEDRAMLEILRDWTGSDVNNRAFRLVAPLIEAHYKMEPGSAIRYVVERNGHSVNSHHFMPLSVVVPMKAYDGHDYVLRLPHIVHRAEGSWVMCLDGEVISGTRLVIVGSKSVPASDEEVHAVVESLTPTAIANMMVHQYFRPVLDTALGINDVEEDEDENSDEPPEAPSF